MGKSIQNSNLKTQNFNNSSPQNFSGSLGGSASKGASSMAELMGRQAAAYSGLKKGDIVDGTVKKLTAQEILLDIGAKSDALVIEYDRKNLENLLSLLQVGDKVKASVISPESEEGFPVVSLRKALDDLMFNRFEKLISTTESMPVTIQDTTRGGFFVESGNGIKGFLPNSQLLSENVAPGSTLEVKVIEFDKGKKRVVFSEKATKYLASLSDINKYIKEGQEVKGFVESVTPYGLFVALEPKEGVFIEGFVHISEISYERVESVAALFKKGDEIKAEVLSIDTENHRVNLSIKKTAVDTFANIKEEYPLETKLKVTVKDVKSRGVTVQIAEGVEGVIPTAKVPSTETYKPGDALDVEVVDYDMKRRQVVVSPVLTTKFVGYR